jgi:hypothetical protein
MRGLLYNASPLEKGDRKVKKKTIKKLSLNKESILRLDPAKLLEVAGGVTNLCTGSADCTESCQHSCGCFSRLC